MQRKPSKYAGISVSRRAPKFGALFVLGLGIFVVAADSDAACALDRRDEQAQVARVVDGDTFVLRDGRKVRLVGVNTPETAKPDHIGEPLADAAMAAVNSLLPTGSSVQLRFDHTATDRHGRTLAHVYSADGRNVAEELLVRGLASAIVVPPNVWQHSCYFAAEKTARNNERGLWQRRLYAPTTVQPHSRLEQRFQFIRGEVTAVFWTAKGARLELNDTLSVRITRRDLRYFSRADILQLRGHTVTVRGWLRHQNGQWQMQLRHPSMISDDQPRHLSGKT